MRIAPSESQSLAWCVRTVRTLERPASRNATPLPCDRPPSIDVADKYRDRNRRTNTTPHIGSSQRASNDTGRGERRAATLTREALLLPRRRASFLWRPALLVCRLQRWPSVKSWAASHQPASWLGTALLPWRPSPISDRVLTVNLYAQRQTERRRPAGSIGLSSTSTARTVSGLRGRTRGAAIARRSSSRSSSAARGSRWPSSAGQVRLRSLLSTKQPQRSVC